MDIPVVDLDNKGNFLSPEYLIKRANKGLSISEQLKSLTILKEVDVEKKLLNEEKSKYKVNLK